MFLDNYTKGIIILQSEQYIYLKGSEHCERIRFCKNWKKNKRNPYLPTFDAGIRCQCD